MQNLDDYIARHLHKPFEWGKNDCITFAMGAVKAATGIDHLRHIRKWNNAHTGRKVLIKFLKHKDIFDAFDVRFRQHKDLKKLKDGDVVLAHNPDETSFSKYSTLVVYKGKLLGVSENGLIAFEIERGDYYFNVRSLRLNKVGR
jgi:hypothetical protein